MILETNTIQEFHENGELQFTETRRIIASSFLYLYPNCRYNSDKKQYWIRTGKMQKFHDNKQLEWQLEYDEFGNCLTNNINGKQFCKNGSVKN